MTKLCTPLCKPKDWSTLGFPVLYYLPELAQTHVHWVSDAIQPSHPLSPSPLALNLFQSQGLFHWAGCSHQVAKVLEFQPQHQSFQWIFRLISFRIDWFALLTVQGTLKTFLQHHNSKASILWCSAFFMIQLSHLYMTTRTAIALTIWGKQKLEYGHATGARIRRWKLKKEDICIEVNLTFYDSHLLQVYAVFHKQC